MIKEAFEVMSDHWAITMWLGLVLMVSLHRTTIKNKVVHHYGKNEKNIP